MEYNGRAWSFAFGLDRGFRVLCLARRWSLPRAVFSILDQARIDRRMRDFGEFIFDLAAFLRLAEAAVTVLRFTSSASSANAMRHRARVQCARTPGMGSARLPQASLATATPYFAMNEAAALLCAVTLASR